MSKKTHGMYQSNVYNAFPVDQVDFGTVAKLKSSVKSIDFLAIV